MAQPDFLLQARYQKPAGHLPDRHRFATALGRMEKLRDGKADLLNVRWIADADLRISGFSSSRLRAGVLTANFESIRYRGSGVFR
jgi:hypothetical protein